MIVGGFFAGVIARLLDNKGIAATRPARSELDVEDAASLRRFLRAGDVLVDAAGPFQSRSTASLESAIELGVDVVDMNESLGYARRVESLRARIAAGGITVRSACSAVSTVAAALVRRSGIERPLRVSALVAPASRETAHDATLGALLASVGAPIELWRDGAFAPAVGWRVSRRFELPGARGYLVESVLSFDLPPIWPSLRGVDTWTDTRTPGANGVLSLVARAPATRAVAIASVPLGALLARTFGTRAGGFGLEIEDDRGRLAHFWLSAARGSYVIAAAPAALAARMLIEERGTDRGLVRPDRHVPVDALMSYLEALGMRLEQRERS